MSQPSNSELVDALEAAWRSDFRYADAVVERVAELRALRDQRTTWFGKYEHDLRARIDVFLRTHPTIIV
jgi:hypothetical protein